MPDRTAALVIGRLSHLAAYLTLKLTSYDDWSRILICFRLRRHIPTFDILGSCTNHRLELSSLIGRGAGRCY
jgi:hypothetical protein